MAERTVEMGTAIANALITDIPLSIPQLEAAYRHYKKLIELMEYSGPRFVDARAEAVRMGNVALERLRIQRKEEEEKLRRVDDDGLEKLR